MSRLIKWFWHADNHWIIFGLTTNLICIFDICWVSTAVALVKNDFSSSTHRKSFRTWFSQMLLTKAWLSVERLFPVSCNTQKYMENNQKRRCSSYIVTEPYNFKILSFLPHGYHTPHCENITLSLLLLSHPIISKIYQPTNWNFWGLVIPFNFFGDR